MAGLSEIESEIIKDNVMEVAEDIMGTPEIQVSMEPGSNKGDNFIGIVYRIVMNRTDSNTGQCTKLFLKVAPTEERVRENVRARVCFIQEIYVYTEVFPCFREFQKSKGILVDEDGFHEHPQCYRTVDTEQNECLFLEDLGEQKFQMVNLHTGELTADHIKLVMKVLGKFHATSMAMKDQQPEKFQNLVANINEIFFSRENSGIALHLNCLPKTLFDAITDDKDAYLLLHLVHLYEQNQFDMGIQTVDATLAEPYAVINHGDCWSNNVMFQYSPEGAPTQAYLIDFQIARYASPACDIMQFILMTTSKTMRDQHFDEFLKIYHESVSLHLLRLGSDPDKVFPYHALLKQLRRFGRFGFFMTVFMLQVLANGAMTDFGDQASNQTDENKTENSAKTKMIRERMRDMVEDMVRLKYI